MASFASMEMGRWLMKWKQTEARIAELEKTIETIKSELNKENTDDSN